MAKRGEERKQRIEAEAHLVSAYVAAMYPEDHSMFRVRLGVIQTELDEVGLTPSELAMVGSFRRWADAIVIQRHQLILIEGAVRPSLGDISVLKAYALLVRNTPELEKWWDLPIRMELVGAIEDPVVRMLAGNEGIAYVIFTTPETEQYITSILPRLRRAPQTGGLI